jgi:dipeptidyl aminopeptidase/acylaminoacyl peptidase
MTTGTQTIESAHVSPDGQWLLYDSNLNGNQDLYKVRITGGEPQQLTHNGADNFSGVWSPDGRQIAFHSLEKGNRDIYVMDSSGANVHPIAATPSEERGPVWSADATRILYLVSPDSIFEIKREGAGWGRGRFLMHSSLIAFSPDGRQFAAGVDPDIICRGCPEGLYVQTDGAKFQRVETSKIDKARAEPGDVVWSTDSRHAFLLTREIDGTSSIWQVPLNGDPELRLIHFTDPTRQMYRESLSLDAHNFYFTLGDRQSDIWTMELKKQ